MTSMVYNKEPDCGQEGSMSLGGWWLNSFKPFIFIIFNLFGFGKNDKQFIFNKIMIKRSELKKA